MTDLIGILSRTHDTGTVEFDRVYDTGIDDLWAAITSPHRLVRWFAPVRGDLVEGGEYEILFDEDDPDQRTWGRIVRCDPPHELVIGWESPGDPAPSRVDVALVAEGPRTRLRLIHSGLTHAQDVGHAAGWEVYIRQLEDELAEVDTTTRPSWWGRWNGFVEAYRDRLGQS